MQKPTLQTILITILIIVALFTSIYFPYKWKQLSNDFLDQTNQYGELLKQINDLQKEVRELRDGDEVDELEDWKIYNNPETDFTFKYPNNWKITEDYFYETAAGIKAKQKTVILQKIENEDSNNWIRINGRQFDCEQGKCVEVGYITIGTYSKNPEILSIFSRITESFKKIEIDDFSDWKTYKNEEYGFEVKYPEDWRIREEYNTDKLFSVDFIFNISPIDEKVFTVKLFKDKSIEEVIENNKNWSGTVNIETILLFNTETTKITQKRPCGPGDKDYKSLNTIYSFDYNGNPYSIWLIPGTCNRDWNKYSDNTLDQILSTFKFIE